MAPTVLTSAATLPSLLQNPLVVLYFTATWCGPCKAIAPALDILSEQYATSIEIVKIDLDQFKNIASQYNITAVPSFVYIDNGNEVNRVRGADFSSIRNAFEALSALNPNAVKAGAASANNSSEAKEIDEFIGKGLSILNTGIFFNEFESLNGVKVNGAGKDISDLVRAKPDNEDTSVISDADSQLLLHIPLANISKVYSILIKSKSAAEDSQRPNLIKIWTNRTSIISFDDAESIAPTHQEDIPDFQNEWVEIKLKLVKFQKVSALDIFLDGDDEDLNTIVDRILIVGIDGEAKMQGKIEKIEHEH